MTNLYSTNILHKIFSLSEKKISLRMLFLFDKSKNEETRFNQGQQTIAVY